MGCLCFCCPHWNWTQGCMSRIMVDGLLSRMNSASQKLLSFWGCEWFLGWIFTSSRASGSVGEGTIANWLFVLSPFMVLKVFLHKIMPCTRFFDLDPSLPLMPMCVMQSSQLAFYTRQRFLPQWKLALPLPYPLEGEGEESLICDILQGDT